MVNRQNGSRIIVLNTALLREASELVNAGLDVFFEAVSGAASAGTILTGWQRLRCAVDQDAVVLAIVVAVAATAIEALDGNVAQERKDVGALPGAAVVDLVEGHGVVDLGLAAAGLGVVKETHGDQGHRGQFPVCEADVEILLGVVAHEEFGGRVEPRHANVARNLVAVASIVVVTDILRVFPAKPIIGSEELKVAERRLATDDGLVSTKLLHTEDVADSEVEVGCERVETLYDGLSVLLLVLSGLLAASGARVSRASLVGGQAVGARLLGLVDLLNLDGSIVGLKTADKRLGRLDSSLSGGCPNLLGLLELGVSELLS